MLSIEQNRMTCSVAFESIRPHNAGFRLNDQTASVGFIYCHIGETMNLFGFFFGLPSAVPHTTLGAPDQGQGKDVAESHRLGEQGFAMLGQLVENTPETAWLDPIDTPFFGTVSRVRLSGHVLFHNAHHAGQIALTLARNANAPGA